MSEGDKAGSLDDLNQAMGDSASGQTGSSTFHTVNHVPKVIGKYDIVKAVGKGSMGTVYSAFDSFSNRTVAIKVAHPQFINQTEDGSRFRKLFFNEAHATAVLDHPSILTLYDAGVDGELCYLVMEYVEGANTLQPFTKADALAPPIGAEY